MSEESVTPSRIGVRTSNIRLMDDSIKPIVDLQSNGARPQLIAEARADGGVRATKSERVFVRQISYIKTQVETIQLEPGGSIEFHVVIDAKIRCLQDVVVEGADIDRIEADRRTVAADVK